MARRSDAATTAAPDGRWTPAQAAEFAALRDFRLLQLLSQDRRAFATARRLGLFRAGQTARTQGSRSTSSQGTAEQQHGSDSTRAPNARMRRSTARAAANRAARAAHAEGAPAAADPATAAQRAAPPQLPAPSTQRTSSTPTRVLPSEVPMQQERMDVERSSKRAPSSPHVLSPAAARAIKLIRQSVPVVAPSTETGLNPQAPAFLPSQASSEQSEQRIGGAANFTRTFIPGRRPQTIMSAATRFHRWGTPGTLLSMARLRGAAMWDERW